MLEPRRTVAAAADSLAPVEGGLVLRRLSVDDLAPFQSYRQDPAVGRFQGWSAMSDADAVAFLRDMGTSALLVPGSWSQLAIADSASNTLQGDIGVWISADSSEAEIGFTLSPAAQGRGVASAAVRAAIAWVFASTPVMRVVGITDARNSASVGVLVRVGMTEVATRDVVFRDEPCVERIFALARPEHHLPRRAVSPPR